MKKLTLRQIADWCGGTVQPQYETLCVTRIQTDSRKVREGDLFIALKGDKVDGHDFAETAISHGAVAALVSRPISKRLPSIEVPDTLRALGAIAAGYRRMLGVKVIGITGSVGKTTTKEMTANVLEGAFRTAKTEGNHNNNLGMPITIMDMKENTEVAVLEMGMNHAGEIDYLAEIAQPDMAVITNIGTMHIEHLGTREGILQAKLEIMHGMKPEGVGVFNGDEPLLWNVRGIGTHKKYYYGIENHACDVTASEIVELDDGVRFVVNGFGQQFELFVPMLGRHTVYNALAAATVGLLLGVTPEKIQTRFSAFHNTGMRQKIYKVNGVTIIEDCYNAGPESTEAALEVLAGMKTNGRRIAVLGDMLELGNRSAAEHFRIGRLAVGKADLLLTYGEHSVRTLTGAVTGGMNPKNTDHFDTHEDMAQMLRTRVSEGDVILFKGSRGMRMERVLQLFLEDQPKP